MHGYSEEKESYPVHAAKAAKPSHTVAAARLAYDVPHTPPWHWEVSLYTWTKSISAGVFIMFAILSFAGQALTPTWTVLTAVLGGLFLALTGVLLIGDLAHPWRFIRIFTRPQWKSWLVRGSFVILGYSLILLVQFILGLTGSTLTENVVLSVPGVILAALTAMYTAFLFAQAKGRDLWQNPSLPLHLFAQATLAGSAVFSILGLFLPLAHPAILAIHITLLASLLIHLSLIVSEMVIPHTTADAAKAATQMFYGKYKGFFWTGLIVGAALPALFSLFLTSVLLPVVASVLALIGLFAYEHAFVQAGQSVPLS